MALAALTLAVPFASLVQPAGIDPQATGPTVSYRA
jgi:hypothetical protein